MLKVFALRVARQASVAVIVLVGLACISCGDGRNFPAVYPVKGKILVNGEPANEAQIVLHRTSKADFSIPTTPQAVTESNGEFDITSYHSKDGAPEGEYVVTIEWRERSGLSKMEFEGADRLGGAYGKVEKTKTMPGFQVKVDKQAVVLPPFNLTQSPEAKRKADAAKKRRGLEAGPLGGGDN